MKDKSSDVSVSPDLKGRVMACVHEAEKKRYRVRLFFSMLVSSISCVALFLTTLWLWRDLSQSGFVDTASLAFSDAGTVSLYWKDFISSLLEFLPFASLMACLASVCALLLSLSYSAKYFHYFLNFRRIDVKYAVVAN